MLKQLKLEMEKVDRMPEEVKRAFIDFYDYVMNTENLGERRMLFHLLKIRKLQDEVGIIPFTEDRIMAAVRWVKQQDYEAWTKIGYLVSLRKFYQFTYRTEPSGDLKKALSVKRSKDHRLTDKDMITREEMEKLIEASANQRDKALWSVLYDSGIRHGELMDMVISDVEFDRYGAILHVPITGKTGYRKVRIIGNSVSYLREWMNVHPRRTDEKAPLFCRIEQHTGEKMDYSNTYKALKLTCRRAGIKRRIYPHLFRHTRATILSTGLKEIPLENQMGWVHGSQMTRVYIHDNDKAQDMAVLKAYGIQVDEEESIKENGPVKCPRCFEPNDEKNVFCWKCGTVLSMTEARKQKEKEMQIIGGMEKAKLLKEGQKEIMDKLSEEELSKILLGMLRKLKEDGRLDEIANNL